jgi:hypothetical protein
MGRLTFHYGMDSPAKSLLAHRGDTENAEFRGGFLLNFVLVKRRMLEFFTAKRQRYKEAEGRICSLYLCAFASLQ